MFGRNIAPHYFCNLFGLTHGVTVALQILVLSVKVRILMGQLRTTSIRWSFYFFRQMIPTSTPAP
jgi:hypothetical protein